MSYQITEKANDDIIEEYFFFNLAVFLLPGLFLWVSFAVFLANIGLLPDSATARFLFSIFVCVAFNFYVYKTIGPEKFMENFYRSLRYIGLKVNRFVGYNNGKKLYKGLIVAGCISIITSITLFNNSDKASLQIDKPIFQSESSYIHTYINESHGEFDLVALITPKSNSYNFYEQLEGNKLKYFKLTYQSVNKNSISSYRSSIYDDIFNLVKNKETKAKIEIMTYESFQQRTSTVLAGAIQKSSGIMVPFYTILFPLFFNLAMGFWIVVSNKIRFYSCLSSLTFATFLTLSPWVLG